MIWAKIWLNQPHRVPYRGQEGVEVLPAQGACRMLDVMNTLKGTKSSLGAWLLQKKCPSSRGLILPLACIKQIRLDLCFTCWGMEQERLQSGGANKAGCLRGDDFTKAWLLKGFLSRQSPKSPNDTGFLYFYPRFTLMMLLS